MSDHIKAMESKPAPNWQALGLIPAGTLGTAVPPEEARRRLAEHFARHPRRELKPGEPGGVVEALREARESRP